MTHIDNISHILNHGITHITSPNQNPNFVPIGDGSLINTRKSFQLSNGKSLGEYIPFYFGPRMPMLYVVQYGYNGVGIVTSENIVYCVTSVASIIDLKLDFVFTNGHANVTGLTKFKYPQDIQNINTILDFEAIKSKYWKKEGDTDFKRRKEAEFLVLGDIPISVILGYAVFNENARIKLLKLGITEKHVVIKPEYYF